MINDTMLKYYFKRMGKVLEKRANYRKKDGQRLTAAEYRSRRKKEIIFHLSLLGAGLLALIFTVVLIVSKISTGSRVEAEAAENPTEEATAEITVVETIVNDETVEEEINPFLEESEDSEFFFEGYEPLNDSVGYLGSEEVNSKNAVLIDLDEGRIIASKDGDVRINPASMTKILTLLVAAKHIEDLGDTYEMTQEIGDYVFSKDCSAVGFSVGEEITVRDMLYGTILPSGADAALCLAEYVAGSQEAFVDMMNDELRELGLSDTAHFTNCVGVYDKDHYCTLIDMAMILKAAEENKLCHEVLNARKYTTSATSEHPEGIIISNWFLRRIEDKDTHGEVVGAKTGFVNQSGCCGASYQISNEGKHYICVTADAYSSWRCIYDHVAIYDEYTN